MIRITLEQLNQRSKDRPEGYISDVLSHAQNLTEKDCELDQISHLKLVLKYAPQTLRQNTRPLPRELWPPAAHLLALRSEPADAGLGHTLERQIGTPNFNFAEVYQSLLFGRAMPDFLPCHLNHLYPL